MIREIILGGMMLIGIGMVIISTVMDRLEDKGRYDDNDHD